MAATRHPHPNLTRSIWGNEWNVQYLKDRWGKDSPAAIAAVLGTTKNACIGKAHRLGLDHLGDPARMPGGYVQTRTPRPPYQRHGSQGYRSPNNPGGIRMARFSEPFLPGLETAPNKQPRAVPARSLTVVHSEPTAASRVTQEHIKSDQCRWIIEGHGKDTLMCGEKVATESRRLFCPHHAARSTDKRKTEEVRTAYEQGRAA